MACWRNCFQSVRPIVDFTLGDSVPTLAVTIEIEYWADRSVDGQLLPVDTKTRKLCIEVAEISSLQKWIVE